MTEIEEEHDGGTDPETTQPYALPTIDNAIFIGRGADAGKRIDFQR